MVLIKASSLDKHEMALPALLQIVPSKKGASNGV